MKKLPEILKPTSNLKELTGYQPNNWQKKVRESNVKRKVIVAGRRAGKTRYIVQDEKDGLAGQLVLPNKYIWVVAPTFDLTGRVWNYLYSLLIRQFRPIIKKLSDYNKTVETKYGTKIECKSGDDPEKLVGEGLTRLYIDEAGILKPKCWKESLQPALLDKKGDAIFIGTPKGKNWFHELYIKGQDPLNERWDSWRFTSYDNKYLDKAEIDELIKDMPEVEYHQEILAEFTEDAGQVFRNIEAGIKGDYEEPESIDYTMGVDIAKHQDFTVIWVVRNDNKHFVYHDRFKELDWGLIKQRIKNAYEKYNKADIWLDSTGVGDAIYDDLVGMGVENIEPYRYTQQTKLDLINNCAIMLENGELSFPNCTQLINELKSFSYERLPSGKFRYNAPEGLHDDEVNAFMLACYGLKEGSSIPQIYI